MMNFIKDKRIRFILILFIIALSLAVYRIVMPENIPIEIVKTDPLNKQEMVETSKEIVMYFNQDITKISGWNITSFPDFAFKTSIQNDTLVIKPTSPLQENMKYSIEITNVRGFYYTFSFSTRISVPVIEDAGLGDPDFTQKHQKNVDNYYPLLKYLNNEEFSDWSISYNGPFKLIVTLKKNTPEARKEVFLWIEERGVDPESHEITWKVQR